MFDAERIEIGRYEKIKRDGQVWYEVLFDRVVQVVDDYGEWVTNSLLQNKIDQNITLNKN